MGKNLFLLFLIGALCPFLCGCQTVQIQTQSGGLGHRADALKKYVGGSSYDSIDNGIEIKSNVIYMGKEYENNTFGPGRVKFVFEK